MSREHTCMETPEDSVAMEVYLDLVASCPMEGKVRGLRLREVLELVKRCPECNLLFVERFGMEPKGKIDIRAVVEWLDFARDRVQNGDTKTAARYVDEVRNALENFHGA